MSERITLTTRQLRSARLSPAPGNRSVFIVLTLPVGSLDERPGEEGAAHLLEHLCFKGTPSHPDAISLSRAIERIGGVSNAATDRETTSYWISVPKRELEQGAALLGEIVFAHRYSEHDLLTEREVVVEEIASYDDDPEYVAESIAERGIFGIGNPLARDIAGSAAQVRSIPIERLRAFHTKHYRAERASLAIAGDLTRTEATGIVRSIERAAASHRGRRPGLRPIPRSLGVHSRRPLAPEGARYLVAERPGTQAHFALALPSFARDHRDSDALEVAAAVLGEGSASRLFARIREELGLAYEIGVASYEYRDAGIFLVSAAVEVDRLTRTISEVVHELTDWAERAPSGEELDRAKGYLAGGLERTLDEPAELAEWLADGPLLHARERSIDEILAGYMAVTPEHALAAARAIVDPASFRLGVAGPAHALVEVKGAIRKGLLRPRRRSDLRAA
jgi:predicted Zn-dependent peptidase